MENRYSIDLTPGDLYNIKLALDHIMADCRVRPADLRACEHTLGKVRRHLEENNEPNT